MVRDGRRISRPTPRRIPIRGKTPSLSLPPIPMAIALAGGADGGDGGTLDAGLHRRAASAGQLRGPVGPRCAAGGGRVLVGTGAAATADFKLPNFQQVIQDAQSSSIDLLRDVELNVKIELGRARMLVEDVLKLAEGSVVELDKLAGDPVDVFVNERLVARGEVLVLNDNFCVRVNEIVAGRQGRGHMKRALRSRPFSFLLVGAAYRPARCRRPFVRANPAANAPARVREPDAPPPGSRLRRPADPAIRRRRPRTRPRRRSDASATAPEATLEPRRVVAALAAVIGLIFVLRWGGKRLFATPASARASRSIRVLVPHGPVAAPAADARAGRPPRDRRRRRRQPDDAAVARSATLTRWRPWSANSPTRRQHRRPAALAPCSSGSSATTETEEPEQRDEPFPEARDEPAGGGRAKPTQLRRPAKSSMA